MMTWYEIFLGDSLKFLSEPRTSYLKTTQTENLSLYKNSCFLIKSRLIHKFLDSIIKKASAESIKISETEDELQAYTEEEIKERINFYAQESPPPPITTDKTSSSSNFTEVTKEAKESIQKVKQDMETRSHSSIGNYIPGRLYEVKVNSIAFNKNSGKIFFSDKKITPTYIYMENGEYILLIPISSLKNALKVSNNWESFYQQTQDKSFVDTILGAMGIPIKHRYSEFQIWKSTSPINSILSLDLITLTDPFWDIIVPIYTLLYASSPSTSKSGFLNPPGPIGLTAYKIFADVWNKIAKGAWQKAQNAGAFSVEQIGQAALSILSYMQSVVYGMVATVGKEIANIVGVYGEPGITVRVGNLVVFPNAIIKDVNVDISITRYIYGLPYSSSITFEIMSNTIATKEDWLKYLNGYIDNINKKNKKSK